MNAFILSLCLISGVFTVFFTDWVTSQGSGRAGCDAFVSLWLISGVLSVFFTNRIASQGSGRAGCDVFELPTSDPTRPIIF